MIYEESMPLEEIVVPENRLRELRDYTGLAGSMKEVGLLQPITVTEGGVLVAGRHRLEAARSLGWGSIPAFVVEEDSLKNRLTEIDENLRRLDLTVYEQSTHAEERERVLEAMGQRQKAGGSGNNQHGRNPATVAGFQKTTQEIAQESGMSERSWQMRAKIGRGLGELTRSVLDGADLTEERHRSFLNSTSQLNHLANISNKRGDERAAETAERVLNGEFKSTFDAYPEVKAEAKKEYPAGSETESMPDLPPFDLPEERRAYKKIILNLKEIARLDNERVVGFCKGPEEAEREEEHLTDLIEKLDALRAGFKAKRREFSNLRAVK